MTTHSLAQRLLAAPEQEIGTRGVGVIGWLLSGLQGRKVIQRATKYGVVRYRVPIDMGAVRAKRRPR